MFVVLDDRALEPPLPDVADGAVRAYLHALNKATHAKDLEARALEKASYLWGV